jgi:hypothetical protein
VEQVSAFPHGLTCAQSFPVHPVDIHNNLGASYNALSDNIVDRVFHRISLKEAHSDTESKEGWWYHILCSAAFLLQSTLGTDLGMLAGRTVVELEEIVRV